MPSGPIFTQNTGSASGGETLGRCKQCGAPVNMSNIVKGPTGLFCSEECKQRHENFVQRAAELEQRERPVGGLFSVRLRSTIASILVIAVVLLAAGFVADFSGIDIPIISTFYYWVLSRFGL